MSDIANKTSFYELGSWEDLHGRGGTNWILKGLENIC